MRILTDLYRYNNWANARVFAACAALDAALLREEAPGTHGTIEGTLKHLVGVEAAYLLMLQGLPLDQGDGQEAYFAQELAWFAEHAAQVGAGYLQLLADQGDALLDRDLAVPWFDFALTASTERIRSRSSPRWVRGTSRCRTSTTCSWSAVKARRRWCSHRQRPPSASHVI